MARGVRFEWGPALNSVRPRRDTALNSAVQCSRYPFCIAPGILLGVCLKIKGGWGAGNKRKRRLSYRDKSERQLSRYYPPRA
eukprot:2960940-Rhodomonas_salina.1